jgi:glutamate/tyrosine decarboxylase-like PLP-dependent enzyme
MAPTIETMLLPDEVAALRQALEIGISYREGLDSRPIPPQIGAEEATLRFATALAEGGRPAAEVMAELVRLGDAGLLQIASPGFFGYVLGASHPVGVAADIITSAWAQVTSYAETTPTTVAIENAVAADVIGLLGLPPESGAGIVTGATVANTVAVMAARGAALRTAGWDVEADGLFGAPEIHVVAGAEAHSAIDAALRYAGLGARRVHRVETDDQGRILVDAFTAVLAPLTGPILVILQAGHVNSGAFDPFAELIPIAHAKGAWVHVDGAFGLWVNAVPELADRSVGVETADSWAVDLHKWLNAPYDSAMVIVRDRAALVSAMSAKGAYLPGASNVPDPADMVLELSRRARGLPSWALLQHLGASGVREMIARHCRLAEWVAQQLRDEPGLTVLNEITANQVAFFCGTDADRDDQTAAVLHTIHQRGRVYPSHGHWRGGEIIRVSISGHRTTDADVALLVDEIRSAWRAVRAAGA